MHKIASFKSDFFAIKNLYFFFILKKPLFMGPDA